MWAVVGTNTSPIILGTAIRYGLKTMVNSIVNRETTQQLPKAKSNGSGSLGRVCIQTHGCKLNQADSEALGRSFLQAGYTLVDPSQPADVYIINSCTVTHVADGKARQALRGGRRGNPSALVVATGCYAQRAPNELERMGAVDLVVGNDKKDLLAEIVMAARGDRPVPCTVGDDLPLPMVGRSRAMVKIQEGCNQVCAYCIVPKVRGRERSVPPEVLLKQVRRRVDEGYKEVVLTGTQLGSYGYDLVGSDLRGLVARLLRETSLERLRVSSLQPQEITWDLLGLWQDHRLCPHFHIPLQSGSDPVLRRMRRRYTTAEYAKAVERVRATVPGVAITADVIVGFPGEEETHFRESLRFAQQMEFASMHVFPYSVRPGTSAAYMGPRVNEEGKRARMEEMLAVARKQAATARRRSIGTIRDVLWERSETWEGRPVCLGLTDNYLKVHTEQPDAPLNQITRARLVAEAGERMVAKLL